MTLVAVLGSSGFVGRAVTSTLTAQGADVRRVPAPRVLGTDDADRHVDRLADALSGVDAVVNAAGYPGATDALSPEMVGANSVLPRIVLDAARRTGVGRFVHVSSAAVQGRRQPLDSSWDLEPFSAYSRSKAAGELELRSAGGSGWTVYRPGGVHGPSRRVTEQVARLARSPLAVVPRTARPTPLTLVGNVAAAVTFLALSSEPPPPVVHHPWEGLTTHSVLTALGGRAPRRVPDTLAAAALASAGMAVGAVGGDGHLRRLEILWRGQEQAVSWLTTAGWRPLLGPDAWRQLGAILATTAASSTRRPIPATEGRS